MWRLRSHRRSCSSRQRSRVHSYSGVHWNEVGCDGRSRWSRYSKCRVHIGRTRSYDENKKNDTREGDRENRERREEIVCQWHLGTWTPRAYFNVHYGGIIGDPVERKSLQWWANNDIPTWMHRQQGVKTTTVRSMSGPKSLGVSTTV